MSRGKKMLEELLGEEKEVTGKELRTRQRKSEGRERRLGVR
jgi:hypothetical protein